MTNISSVSLETREAQLLAEWQRLQAERQQIDAHIERVRLNVQQRSAAERAQAEREQAQQRKSAYDQVMAGIKADFAALDSQADDLRDAVTEILNALQVAARRQRELVKQYFDLAVKSGAELWDNHPEFADNGRQAITALVNGASVLNMPTPKADFYTDAYRLNLSITDALRTSGKIAPVTGIVRRDNPSFWGEPGETQHLVGGQRVKPTETPRIAQIAQQAINLPPVPQMALESRPIEPDSPTVAVTIRSGVESALKAAPQPPDLTLPVKAWLDRFTQPGAAGTKAGDLYAAYLAAAQAAQVSAIGSRAFSNELIGLGYEPERRRTGSYYALELRT